MKIGIIIEVGNVPEGWVVTKRTGTVEHTVRKAITIYGTDKGKQVIDAAPGSCFLVNDRGDISAITNNTKVSVVCGDLEDAIDLLRALRTPEDK